MANWENEPKVGAGGGWEYDSLSTTYDDMVTDMPLPEDVESEQRPVAYDGIGNTTTWSNETQS